MTRRSVGVLGGMGPAATIDFMHKVLAHSQRVRGPDGHEQDDVRLIVDSNPAVPDRNAAVAGTGPSPGPFLASMARGLASAGADFLVMPCNAAHAFADAVRDATSLPFVSLIDAAVAALLSRFPRLERVGVLAVEACADARLYERALEPAGIDVLSPQGEVRRRFMDTIWAIKRGDRSGALTDSLRGTADALAAQGASVILAACTEVPLLLADGDLAVPLIDPTEVLARRTVDYALGEPFPANAVSGAGAQRGRTIDDGDRPAACG